METFRALREAEEMTREEMEAELESKKDSYEKLKGEKALLRKVGKLFKFQDWNAPDEEYEKAIQWLKDNGYPEKGASNAIYDYSFVYYEEIPSDMKWLNADIMKLERKLAPYKAQEVKANEFEGANIGNPVQPIIDFCNQWAEKFKTELFKIYNEWHERVPDSFEWIRSQHIEDPRVESFAGSLAYNHNYFEMDRIKEDGTYDWEGSRLAYLFKRGSYDYYDENDKRVTFELTDEVVRQSIQAVLPYMEMRRKKEELWEQLKPYYDKVKSRETTEQGFNRIVDDMKQHLMDSFINKTEKYVGKILDARDLKVDKMGNLNGIVIGEMGKAKVETVGCGGWNIQRYHLRVLVKKIK